MAWGAQYIAKNLLISYSRLALTLHIASSVLLHGCFSTSYGLHFVHAVQYLFPRSYFENVPWNRIRMCQFIQSKEIKPVLLKEKKYLNKSEIANWALARWSSTVSLSSKHMRIQENWHKATVLYKRRIQDSSSERGLRVQTRTNIFTTPFKSSLKRVNALLENFTTLLGKLKAYILAEWGIWNPFRPLVRHSYISWIRQAMNTSLSMPESG